MGIPHPHTIATIVIKGRSNVPSIKSMWRPGSTLVRFDMDEDAGTRRGNRGAIEIKMAMDLGPSRQLWVDA